MARADLLGHAVIFTSSGRTRRPGPCCGGPSLRRENRKSFSLGCRLQRSRRGEFLGSDRWQRRGSCKGELVTSEQSLSALKSSRSPVGCLLPSRMLERLLPHFLPPFIADGIA